MSTTPVLFANLAIVTSGLAVTTEIGECDMNKIHAKMCELYPDNVKYWVSRAHTFADLAPFMDELSQHEKDRIGQKAPKSDDSLWRKYLALKRGIVTTAGPMWAQIANGNEPTTGKKKAELLLALRKRLYANESRSAKEMKDDWYPPYWLAFLHYGPCADDGTAADAFAARRSNGPTAAKRQADALTHREQRELLNAGPNLNREEIRRLERNSKKAKKEDTASTTLAAVMSRANDIQEMEVKIKQVQTACALYPDETPEDALKMFQALIAPAPTPPARAPSVPSTSKNADTSDSEEEREEREEQEDDDEDDEN